MDVQFVPLTGDHIVHLQSWYREDDCEKHLGGWDYIKNLMDLQQRFPNRHCFVALHGNVPRGIVDLEVNDDGTAWMSLFIEPSQRGQGLGKAVLKAFLRHPVVAGLRELKAEIEQDNVASTRCFETAGFEWREDPSTTEGYVLLVHEKA
ncbi:MAG: GNAT family N-acetyltransferase [Candidatus Peribacteraceae bacterium]|jgi:RimJ/RimL family protein N-acetyltransferase|nr:GNAT family N-acetyltransferase [Candidatus Peribacteraceae bacterium]